MKGILNEIRFFKSHEHNMKVLLLNSSLKFEIMAKQLYVASQRVL